MKRKEMKERARKCKEKEHLRADCTAIEVGLGRK